MKKGLLGFLFLFASFAAAFGQSQKISDMPTFVGDPAGGYIPIVISGLNRKIDASQLKTGATSTVAGLRSINLFAGLLYTTTDYGGGRWIADTADHATADNTGDCIVGANGVRLRRSYSGKADIRWYGAKGDGVFDNYAILHQFWTNLAYPTDIYIPKGTFYSSKQDSVKRFIHIAGEEGYEGVSSNVLKYPKGQSGLTFNDVNSPGSIIEGITLSNTMPTGGNVLEFNATDNTLLYLGVVSLPTNGTAYEFFDPYDPKTIKGSGTFSATPVSVSRFLSFSSSTGTFQKGDVITGATSGASATVLFVSKLYNLVATGAISGTFAVGETVTGNTSGATGLAKQVFATNGLSYTRAVTLSGVTGDLNGVNEENKRMTAFREVNTYSVGLNINRRVQIKNTTILNFGADGVLITSTTAPAGNANLTRLYNVRSNANGANGVRVQGGDANVVEIDGSTFVNNRGLAIVDQSFLGITVNTPHASGNMSGGYSSGSYINRKSIWINPYTEGGYIVTPYQNQESYIGGGSVIYGGVRGLEVVNDNFLVNGGGDFDLGSFKNNRTYTDGNSQVFTQVGGLTAEPLDLDFRGNYVADRPLMLGFRTPWGTGIDRTGKTKSLSVKSADLLTSFDAAGKYYFRQRVKRNPPKTIAIVGGSGSGAIVVADFLNGKVSGLTTLASGVNYPVNGTTATLAAPSGGTAAQFKVTIADGHLNDITIVDSGTNYPNTDFIDLFETSANSSFRPVTNGTGTLGEAGRNFANIYSNAITLPATTAPTGPTTGTVYNDGTHLNYYNGSAFVQLDNDAATVTGAQTAYTVLGNHTAASATPTYGKLPVQSISATGSTYNGTKVLYDNGTWQTPAAGGGGSINVVDSPEHVITGGANITWTATTAPTGTTNTWYKWTRVGNMVSFSMRFGGSTAGAGVTGCVIAWPSEVPVPETFTSANGATYAIVPGNGWLSTSASGGLAASITSRAYLQVNSAGTGYQINISEASGAYVMGLFQVTYKCVGSLP